MTLDDPVVQAALRAIGNRIDRAGEICPNCARRPINLHSKSGLCDRCEQEQEQLYRESKRLSWHRRQERLQKRSGFEAAVAWLKVELRHGPRPSKQLKARARTAGISIRTLQRAGRELGVEVSREGWRGEHTTMWALTRANDEAVGASTDEGGAGA